MIDVAANRERFIELINSITRESFTQEAKDRLIAWLDERSDFFVAPASTKYHGSCEGGLCEHSLRTYEALHALADQFLVDTKEERDADGEVTGYQITPHYDEDSLKIVGLFHDIAKANFYEKYSRNVKDESGKWVAVQEYRTIAAEKRFIFGSQEQTSEFMLRCFIDLTVEESVAILHHLGGKGYDSTQVDMSLIFSRYPLALMLHTADLISTYYIENREKEDAGAE